MLGEKREMHAFIRDLGREVRWGKEVRTVTVMSDA